MIKIVRYSFTMLVGEADPLVGEPFFCYGVVVNYTEDY